MEEVSEARDQVAVIAFTAALVAAYAGGFLPLLTSAIWVPAAKVHFGVSGIAMGLVASMEYTLSAITSLFLAPRLTTRRPRLIFLCGLITIFLTTVASALLSPTFPFFILLRAIEGAAVGVCTSTVIILANRTARPSRSFGALQLSQTTASFLAYSLIARLINHFGLAGVYIIVAAIVLLCIIVVFLSKGWQPVANSASSSRITTGNGALPVMRIAIAAVGMVLVFAAFIAIYTTTGIFGDRAELTLRQIGTILAIATPIGTVGALITTILAGRPSLSFLAVIAAIGAITCGVGLAVFSHSFISLAVSFCGFIFFVCFGVPTIFAIASRLEPTGRAAAAVQSSQMMGLALGPTLGAVIGRSSITGLGLAAGITMGTGFVLVAAVGLVRRQRIGIALASG
jgi:predicted MFS family arabinose efflux permease